MRERREGEEGRREGGRGGREGEEGGRERRDRSWEEGGRGGREGEEGGIGTGTREEGRERRKDGRRLVGREHSPVEIQQRWIYVQ